MLLAEIYSVLLKDTPDEKYLLCPWSPLLFSFILCFILRNTFWPSAPIAINHQWFYYHKKKPRSVHFIKLLTIFIAIMRTVYHLPKQENKKLSQDNNKLSEIMLRYWVMRISISYGCDHGRKSVILHFICFIKLFSWWAEDKHFSVFSTEPASSH